MKVQRSGLACASAIVVALATAACNPTVRVQAPDKPIEINMNIKIEHEIRIKVEKDVKQMLENNKDLF